MPRITGSISLPGDKSISHRAALFSALTPAENSFTNFNMNADCRATLDILKNLGIDWVLEDDLLTITGNELSSWQPPAGTLDAKNSGTTTRLLSGLLCHLPFPTVIDGDNSLRNRPMKRVIDPLQQMGAKIEHNQGKLPLKFMPVGELHGIGYNLPVASAQVKSALCLAARYANSPTEITENWVTRDHTERMLGLPVIRNGKSSVIKVNPGYEIPQLSMPIPGDFSSAAFFLVAALINPGSQLEIRNVSLNPTRTGLLKVFELMGITYHTETTRLRPEPIGNIRIESQEFSNVEIPSDLVPVIIDEIPILSVLGLFGRGELVVKNAEELRYKESDRIARIVQMIRTFGGNIDELPDGFILTGQRKLNGGYITTDDDHRIAMSAAIASTVIESDVKIDKPECVEVSLPSFWELLHSVSD